MESKAKKIIDKYENEDILWEFANLYQKETNLPMIVFVSPKGKAKHGPRIKVQTNHSHKSMQGKLVSITIEDSPKIIGKGLSSKDFELVKKFIIDNKETLINYWNERIVTSEMIQKLKKIGG